MNSRKDSIYASPVGEVGAFKFDEKEANVFPDMISCSVPGYQAIISALGLLADRFASPHSVCYDLGCSLGAATLSMRQQIETEDCRILVVDNSDAMVGDPFPGCVGKRSVSAGCGCSLCRYS